MEQNPQLAMGMLCGSDGKLNKLKLLAELSNKLNSIGVHKTGEEWLKVIFDIISFVLLHLSYFLITFSLY